MNASVWALKDINDSKKAKKQENNVPKTFVNHVSLLLDSIRYDVIEKDCDASIATLFSASDNMMSQAAADTTGMKMRHRRELGSVQAHAFSETRHAGGNETLAQEADLLESLWDASMAEEDKKTTDSTESRRKHDSVWNQYWQQYGNDQETVMHVDQSND
jgi:hypothetical protein